MLHAKFLCKITNLRFWRIRFLKKKMKMFDRRRTSVRKCLIAHIVSLTVGHFQSIKIVVLLNNLKTTNDITIR